MQGHMHYYMCYGSSLNYKSSSSADFQTGKQEYIAFYMLEIHLSSCSI